MACCTSTTARSRSCLRHRAVHHGQLRRRAGRHRLHVHQHPQGLHSRSGHRPDLGHHRSAAGHLVITRWSIIRSRWPTSCAQDPNVEALMSTVGGTAAHHRGRPQLTAQLLVRLKPRAQRKEGVNEIIDELRPQAGRDPGHEGVPAESAHHPHRRPGHQEPVPVLDAIAQQAGAVRQRPQKMEARSRRLPASRTSPAIWPSPARRSKWTSTATKPPPCKSTPTRSKSAFYDAYGPHWVSTIYAAINEYEVLLELKPQYQADPQRACRCCISKPPAAS